MPIACKHFAAPLLLTLFAAALSGCAHDGRRADARDPYAHQADGRRSYSYWRHVESMRSRTVRHAHATPARAKPAKRVAEAAAASPPVKAAAAAPAPAPVTTVPPPAAPAGAKIAAPAAAVAPPAPAAVAPKGPATAPAAGVAVVAPPPAKQAAPAPAAVAGTMESARRLFMAGQVMKAREILLSLVPGPNGEALLELARTFDPHYLMMTNGRDATADMTRARALYEEAAKKGSAGAAGDLKRIQGDKPAAPRT